jgi:NAD(P)-dependent dehydrogenase (short-subunit alcohol dehydrogenase family)
MDLGLAGRTALVTGSYRGTGAGIARVLAAEGATVLVHGLEPGQAAGTRDEIVAAGGQAHAVTGDLRSETGTAQLVAEVAATRIDGAAPHVDIVVNNWGLPEGSDWESSDTTSWHGSYDVNVVSAVRVTQAFLPAMRAAGWGRVVFVSTVGATRPGDRIPEYYAAKGALPSVAVGLAKHLSGTGVTVNCVSPGMIATPEVVASFTERAEKRGLPTDPASVASFMLETGMTNHTGRVCTPDDVGRFVAFVVSEAAWHLDGAHLRFDGGASDAVT